MKKILIDSDVCLDSFTGRYPHSIYADKLLLSVEDGAVTGIVSAESFSNLYYVIRKLSSHENAIHLLNELRTIVAVGTLTPEVVESALNSGWKDFEDALQHYCAINEGCGSIVTRNGSDFMNSEIPVYTPSEWLEIQ